MVIDFYQEGYEITLEENKYINLFHNHEKIEYLLFEKTNYTLQRFSAYYYNLINFHICESYRNKGLGKFTFNYLIENLPSDVYALIWSKDKILNKVQIPKIFSKYDVISIGNYEIIKNKNYDN